MLSCDPARPETTYWCSFGGAVDEGESLPEAGVRELREETGLSVSSADLGESFDRAEVSFSYDGATWNLRVSATSRSTVRSAVDVPVPDQGAMAASRPAYCIAAI